MAIYHNTTYTISRSRKGISAAERSAVGASAYRSGSKLVQRKGTIEDFLRRSTGSSRAIPVVKTHDYSRRTGVLHTALLLPDGVNASWTADRSTLWNTFEAAENRSNSRLAREYRVGLPHELGDEQRVELVTAYAKLIVERFSVVVDLAVHAPSPGGDQRNFHAHLLASTRTISNAGPGAKSMMEQSNGNLKKAGLPLTQDLIGELRFDWEKLANEHLQRAGCDARIDCRSYADRHIAMMVPTSVHVGQIYANARDLETGESRILPPPALSDDDLEWNADSIRICAVWLQDRLSSGSFEERREEANRLLKRFVPINAIAELAECVVPTKAAIERLADYGLNHQPNPKVITTEAIASGVVRDDIHSFYPKISSAAASIATRHEAEDLAVEAAESVLAMLPRTIQNGLLEMRQTGRRVPIDLVDRLTNEYANVLRPDVLRSAILSIKGASTIANGDSSPRDSVGRRLGTLCRGLASTEEALNRALEVVLRSGLQARPVRQTAPVSTERGTTAFGVTASVPAKTGSKMSLVNKAAIKVNGPVNSHNFAVVRGHVSDPSVVSEREARDIFRECAAALDALPDVMKFAVEGMLQSEERLPHSAVNEYIEVWLTFDQAELKSAHDIVLAVTEVVAKNGRGVRRRGSSMKNLETALADLREVIEGVWSDLDHDVQRRNRVAESLDVERVIDHGASGSKPRIWGR